jgi:hypothetical protein
VGDADSTEQAYRDSRSRAEHNESGIGAAYLGRPARHSDASEWRGVFAIASRNDVTEALVVVKDVSRHARFDAEALARAVEELVAERGGARGQTIVLDRQRDDFLTLFPSP